MNSPLMVVQLVLPGKAIHTTARAAMIETAQLRARRVMDLPVMAGHVGTALENSGAA